LTRLIGVSQCVSTVRNSLCILAACLTSLSSVVEQPEIINRINEAIIILTIMKCINLAKDSYFDQSGID
jgi:hypothetical protein